MTGKFTWTRGLLVILTSFGISWLAEKIGAATGINPWPAAMIACFLVGWHWDDLADRGR